MSTARIMIVDDEEEILKSYLAILQPEDSSVDLEKQAAFLFDESGPSDEMGDDLDNILNLDEDFEENEIIMISDELIDVTSCDLISASQGLEAVEIFKQSLEEDIPVALVFLDMRMPPGIDGLETAKLLRELDPWVEIVIMTAYSDYTLDEIIKELGSPERILYFHKPFEAEQIRQLASNLTQKWFLEKKSR